MSDEKRSDEGQCGNELQGILGARHFCSLRVGHLGWHAEGEMSWSQTNPEHSELRQAYRDLYRMADALTLIDRYGCTNYTGPNRCIDSPERHRGAHFTSVAWCDACIAHDALHPRSRGGYIGGGEVPVLIHPDEQRYTLDEVRAASSSPDTDNEREAGK